ncbi:MAG: hypothetical protein P1U81_10925 [Verrucomicrobiales bacterium]|nr:hypothetical protein [Verrucomicrobiales bacterium]
MFRLTIGIDHHWDGGVHEAHVINEKEDDIWLIYLGGGSRKGNQDEKK